MIKRRTRGKYYFECSSQQTTETEDNKWRVREEFTEVKSTLSRILFTVGRSG